MTLVLDASVTIAWLLQDESSVYADAALEACETDRAIVPALWRWEIANTLLVLERRGRLADAVAAYASLRRSLPVHIATTEHAAREIELARRHVLSAYDAAYLALALEENAPLATLDAKLARAAETERFLFRP